MMNFIFGLQKYIKVFGKLRVCSQVCPKYPKYDVCISLQYLQKNMGDEFAF